MRIICLTLFLLSPLSSFSQTALTSDDREIFDLINKDLARIQIKYSKYNPLIYSLQSIVEQKKTERLKNTNDPWTEEEINTHISGPDFQKGIEIDQLLATTTPSVVDCVSKARSLTSVVYKDYYLALCTEGLLARSDNLDNCLKLSSIFNPHNTLQRSAYDYRCSVKFSKK